MVIDVIIATFRLMANNDHFSVKIDRIERLLTTLMENKDKLLRNNTNLIIDSDINNLLNKDYILKIDLEGNIYINMTLKDANNYLANNPKLSFAVYNSLKIASYNYKLENTFPFESKFIYGSPNNTYKLHFSDTGENKIENKLYTDGELDLVSIEPRMVDVINATYVLNVLEFNKLPNKVDIYTTKLSSEFFEFILNELERLHIEEGYKTIGKEPRIYQKYRN